MTTISTSISTATATTSAANVRHFSWGSVPSSTTTSRVVPGSAADDSSFDGQSISLASPSMRRTSGRVAEKSKNSSGSMVANGVASHRSRRKRDGARSGVGGVVPTFERGNHHRPTEARPAVPEDMVHGVEVTWVPVAFPVGVRSSRP